MHHRKGRSLLRAKEEEYVFVRSRHGTRDSKETRIRYFAFFTNELWERDVGFPFAGVIENRWEDHDEK